MNCEYSWANKRAFNDWKAAERDFIIIWNESNLLHIHKHSPKSQFTNKSTTQHINIPSSGPAPSTHVCAEHELHVTLNPFQLFHCSLELDQSILPFWIYIRQIRFLYNRINIKPKRTAYKINIQLIDEKGSWNVIRL